MRRTDDISSVLLVRRLFPATSDDIFPPPAFGMTISQFVHKTSLRALSRDSENVTSKGRKRDRENVTPLSFFL